MKLKPLLLLLVLSPMVTFCQTLNFPVVGSAEDGSTQISKIEVTGKNTIVTFKHASLRKGDWVQLNKSIYLQDAKGEDRYDYVRSEGIPLRPLKHMASSDNEELEFKVYFEKLKPGTKAINVIERARSAEELQSGVTFLNYYNVSLERPEGSKTVTVSIMPPPPVEANASSFDHNAMFSSFGPVITQMQHNILDAKLEFYSNPAKVAQMAKINKSYYDALRKEGFSYDDALKIITSSQLISTDFGKQ